MNSPLVTKLVFVYFSFSFCNFITGFDTGFVDAAFLLNYCIDTFINILFSMLTHIDIFVDGMLTYL